MEVKNETNKYLYGNGFIIESYRCLAVDAINTIAQYATPTQIRKLKSDLQFEGEKFDEAKFLQAACETAVAASLAKMFGKRFKYEPKLNPPSDVDCSFSEGDFTYNIEVKCPNYMKKHEQDGRNVFSIGSFGRIPEFSGLTGDLKQLFSESSPDKPLEVQPHMDNKLKDYLLSANKKFSPTTEDNELNVLLICCDSPMDIQKWFFYMYGMQGLFTSESYHPPIDYSSVDAVILTNLYHRHYDYHSKDKVNDHWDLRKSFNLIFKNRCFNRGKDAAIWNLVDIFPNHSNQMCAYDLVDGFEELRIPSYITHELMGKGEYYFQPSM